MRQFEGVCQVQMAHEVGVKTIVAVLKIVEVLATHILRSELSAKALQIESQHAIADKRGRECNGGVAFFHSGLAVEVVPCVGVVVAHIAHIVFDAVAAQCAVDVPAKPVGNFHAGLQFHTHTVAIGHIFCHQFANFIQFAIEHELVVVFHIVEIHACGETLIAEGVAQFPILQSFCLGMLAHQAIGVIVAGGFFVCHRVGCVCHIMAVEIIVQTHFRVEEIEFFVHIEHLHVFGRCGPVPLIVFAIYLITNVSVLQIGVSHHFAKRFHRCLPIEVEIKFFAFVAIVFVVGIKCIKVIFHPNHIAIVVVGILVDAAAQGAAQIILLVGERKHGATEAAVHILFAHQARFLHFRFANVERLEFVFLQRAGVFVFLVVAKAVGVVQSQIPVPLGAKTLVPEQLVVGLAIIVGLVFVEANHFAVAFDFAIRVVGAIGGQFFTADAIPSVVGGFLAAEGDKAHRSLSAKVAGLCKVGMEFARSAVAIAVGGNMGDARIEIPVASNQAGTHLKGFLIGVERAITARHLGIRIERKALSAHIHARTESARTIGGGAHTALNLHIFKRRSKIGRVHPVDFMALGIIHRNIVGGNVDASGICATHPN